MSDEVEQAVSDVSHFLEFQFGPNLTGWPANPTKYFGDPAREAVRIGRASRDAEVADLREAFEEADSFAKVNAMNAADWIIMQGERDKFRAENRRCYQLQETQAEQIMALRQQLAERDALVESQARQIAALAGSVQDINTGWDKTLEQLAEREAVIDAVDDWFNGLGDAVCPDGERLARLLDASPSAVLAEHDARVWDEGWSARASRAHLKVGECVPAPAHINPYWKGAGQ